jgi:hypothetical protein
MSDEPRKPTSPVRFSVWILVVVLVLSIAFAVWLRVCSYPQVVTLVTLKRSEPRFPTPSRLPPQIPMDKVADIAVEEVKKREGWTGNANTPDREGFTWYVHVSEPGKSGRQRTVAIESTTGEVLEYRDY